jgi:hypothetical protein
MTGLLFRIFWIGLAAVVGWPLGWSQTSVLPGKVETEAGMPLVGATVELEAGKGVVTDEGGLFELPVTGAGPFRISVRYLGYAPLDTLVTEPRQEALILQLQPLAAELPEVAVRSKRLAPFDVGSAWVLDVEVTGNQIYALLKKWRKKELVVFSRGGTLLYSQSVDRDFGLLFRSCLGGIHLLGDKGGVELKPLGDSLQLHGAYSYAEYEELLASCRLSWNDRPIQASFSNHQKLLRYHWFGDQRPEAVLYQTFDEKAAKVASQCYREIMSAYFMAVTYPEPEDIHQGMPPENIVANGTWSGDLTDLIISNEIHTLVSNYLNVESKPIQTLEWEQNGNFMVIDFVRQKLMVLDHPTASPSYHDIPGWDWDSDYKVLTDYSQQEVYFLQSTGEIWRLNPVGGTYQLEAIVTLSVPGLELDSIRLFSGKAIGIIRSGEPNGRAIIWTESLRP